MLFDEQEVSSQLLWESESVFAVLSSISFGKFGKLVLLSLLFPASLSKMLMMRLVFRSWGSLLHVLTHFFFLWILRYSCPWHFADGFFVKAIMSQGSSYVLFLSSSSENKASRKRIGNVSMLLFFSTFAALLTVKVSPFVFRLFTNKLHIRSSRF